MILLIGGHLANCFQFDLSDAILNQTDELGQILQKVLGSAIIAEHVPLGMIINLILYLVYLHLSPLLQLVDLALVGTVDHRLGQLRLHRVRAAVHVRLAERA